MFSSKHSLVGLCALASFATPAQATPEQDWQAFATELGAFSRLVSEAPMPQTEQVQAEGYRTLVRYLSNKIERNFESSDPDFPRLLRMPNSIARIGWDNPDNIYLSAPVRGDHSYRISGNIGSANFVSFNVYNGFVGQGMRSDVRSIGSLQRADLKTDAAGNFELILSPDPHPGNWIKLEKGAQILTIRQVFNDWTTEKPASLDLVNLTTQGTYPKPYDAAQLKAQLKAAVDQTSELRAFFNQAHARLFADDSNVNIVRPPLLKGPGLGMDDPRNRTSSGHFRLAKGEALLLTVPPSQCAYTNIQIGNMWWESLDYANRQTHLNGKMTNADADGMTRYVISSEDPGVPNWLDTDGHDEGTLFMRWTECTAVPVTIDSRVVGLDKLRSALPKATPQVTPEQRRAAIALRQRVVSRRIAGGH